MRLRKSVSGLAVTLAASVLLVAPSAGSASAAVSDCSGTASLYGVLADGRLTYSAMDVASNSLSKVLIGANLGFTPVAMATLNFNTVLVTNASGTLYRVDVVTNGTSLAYNAPVAIGTGWTHRLLAYDGAGHLFGIAGSELLRYDVTAAKPTAANLGNRTSSGTGFTLDTLTATAPNYIIGTAPGTSATQLYGYSINATGGWARSTLSTAFNGLNLLTSAGGGVFYGKTPSGGLYGYHDANPTNGSGSDLTGAGAVNTSGWTQTRLSAMPTSATCGVGITYGDLVAMYGSRVGAQSVVEAGLPSMNAEMAKGGVTTPARKAAWLATILNESTLRYDAVEAGSTATYKGRGFIQLTNQANYSAAGSYLGVDLVGSPSLAASLSYSAPIARWYWTVARSGMNSAADSLNMGQVDIYIGFAGSSDPNNAERLQRCADFKTAYRYFTGVTPAATC